MFSKGMDFAIIFPTLMYLFRTDRDGHLDEIEIFVKLFFHENMGHNFKTIHSPTVACTYVKRVCKENS